MAGFFFSQVILILLWSTGALAQERPEPPTDTADAYNILQGKFLDDCTPDGDVQAIVKELQAIPKGGTGLKGVHARGRYAPREIMFSPMDLLSPSLTENEKAAKIHQMTLNPSATGIEKLDKLNRQFGAVRIVDMSLPGDWLSIQFDNPLDMACVVD